MMISRSASSAGCGKAPSAMSSSVLQSDLLMASEWSVKRITFLGREQVPILLQNANGPCPLLAIANCLALRNQLQTPSRAATVTFAEVVQRVADGLLETNKVALQDPAHQHTQDNAYVLNLRQNIDDCLGVLRWLHGVTHARACMIHHVQPSSTMSQSNPANPLQSAAH
jgi:hypothetical protein